MKPTNRWWRASRSCPNARSSSGTRAISTTWASSSTEATRPVSRPSDVRPPTRLPRSWTAAGQPPVRDEQEGERTGHPPPRSGPLRPSGRGAAGGAEATVTSSRNRARRRRHRRRRRGRERRPRRRRRRHRPGRTRPVHRVRPGNRAAAGRCSGSPGRGPPLGPNPVRPMPASRSSSPDACPRANPPAPAIRATPTAPPASSSRPRLRCGGGAGAYEATGAAGTTGGVASAAGCSQREPLTGWVSSLLMGPASQRALSGGVGLPVRYLCVRRPVRRRRPPWRPRSRA